MANRAGVHPTVNVKEPEGLSAIIQGPDRELRIRAEEGRKEDQMSIIAWLVVGLVAGWIGSMIINRRGEGLFMDIILGIVGAIVGGFVFNMVGHSGVSGINLYSIFVAVIGSVVVLAIYHAVFRRRSF
jgi:uncharacterized membrane protein YeaQ/YmgE (transglycosylase-associated protein family)